MMRVAALYDIHGNLPALEAVLDAVDKQAVDLLLIGGDIAWGPFPSETVERLMDVGDRATFIRGNADREVGGRLGTSNGLEKTVAEINLWAADQLTGQQLEWLLNLPATFSVDIDGIGQTLFCHGSPRSDEEPITPITPVDRLLAALAPASQSIVVCGHTHMQFDRRSADRRVINAGSVGMPYQDQTGAYWALLSADGIDLCKTDYDIEEAANSMKETSCPHVEEVFMETILHPPQMDETARLFERSALKKSF